MEDILIEIREVIANPNWAAQMSAIAALFTVVFAALALVVTIIVAQRQNKISKVQNSITKEQAQISKKQAEIAEQQNKIALFEKRYELYTIIMKSKALAKTAAMLPFCDKPLYHAFLTTFDSKLSSDEAGIENETVSLVMDICYKLNKGKFLFSKDIGEYMDQLEEDLRYYFFVTRKNWGSNETEFDMFKEKRTKFIKTINRLDEDGILNKIEMELQIQTIT